MPEDADRPKERRGRERIAPMQLRRLGRTGLQVSEIGFGAWGIGGTMWIGATQDESMKALHTAVDLGVNFIDTALVYGMGRSEKLVGQLVRERKETLLVATKVPPQNGTWPAEAGVPVAQVFPGAHVTASAEKSLRNLGPARHRPAAAPRLARRVPGRGRRMASRAGGPEVLGQGALPGRVDQRPRPGHGVARGRVRPLRRRAGDLQHLRPGPGGGAVPALPEARRGRAGARPARRGRAHRDHHAGHQVPRRRLPQRVLRRRPPARGLRARPGAHGGHGRRGPLAPRAGAAVLPRRRRGVHRDPRHAPRRRRSRRTRPSPTGGDSRRSCAPRSRSTPGRGTSTPEHAAFTGDGPGQEGAVPGRALRGLLRRPGCDRAGRARDASASSPAWKRS